MYDAKENNNIERKNTNCNDDYEKMNIATDEVVVVVVVVVSNSSVVVTVDPANN